MKLIHLADLHIGKRVNGFSMIEDQEYVLKEILQIIDEEKPEAVLIAGDVYDKSVPSEEAVDLFDDFLVRLSKRQIQVYIISGNHDSASRVAFGGRLMDQSGIHFAPVYDKTIEPMKLSDQFGEVCIWPIPFIKPVHVRKNFENEQISDYTTAMKLVIDHLPIDPGVRNVAIAHQFITGAATCDSEDKNYNGRLHSGESEDKNVGGLDSISAEVYAPFDYVALGHLHGPQQIGRKTIRYAGSPLKYSFSEAGHVKSTTVVELGEKGNIEIREVPLHALHDMVRIRGSFAEIYNKDLKMEDYCEITLTDEEDIPDGLNKLRAFYPNIMSLKYDNTRTRSQGDVDGVVNVEKKSELEIFNELYEAQNGQSMSEEQQLFLQDMIKKIWGDRA